MNSNPNMVFLNRSFDKKRLKALLLWFRLNLSEGAALKAVEILQGLGFRSATQGAISLGLDDLKTPASKGGRVFQAQLDVALAYHEHHRGNRTPVELFQHLVDTWHRTSQDLTKEVVQLFQSTERVNPVYMMAFSGARGNISQVRQLVGMRGLMADPRGQIVGFPILSNFREGLTITEYFVSCYGARKGVVDTAIRTADAGYLTRRLADVSHHVVVRTTNCGTYRNIPLRDIKEGQKTILSLANRLVGRVLAKHVQKSNYELAYRNEEITPDLAKILASQHLEVAVRSPLSCSLRWGVCQLCYGWGLSEGRQVTLGEAVGIIAAQSIGEPGTQLTLRTFHTGGVFSGDLLNEIRAPFGGTVFFTQPLQGLLVRTPHGQVAFLTKVSGNLSIVGKPLPAQQTKEEMSPIPSEFPAKRSKRSKQAPLGGMLVDTTCPSEAEKGGVNNNYSVIDQRIDTVIATNSVHGNAIGGRQYRTGLLGEQPFYEVNSNPTADCPENMLPLTTKSMGIYKFGNKVFFVYACAQKIDKNKKAFGVVTTQLLAKMLKKIGTSAIGSKINASMPASQAPVGGLRSWRCERIRNHSSLTSLVIVSTSPSLLMLSICAVDVFGLVKETIDVIDQLHKIDKVSKNGHVNKSWSCFVCTPYGGKTSSTTLIYANKLPPSNILGVLRSSQTQKSGACEVASYPLGRLPVDTTGPSPQTPNGGCFAEEAKVASLPSGAGEAEKQLQHNLVALPIASSLFFEVSTPKEAEVSFLSEIFNNTNFSDLVSSLSTQSIDIIDKAKNVITKNLKTLVAGFTDQDRFDKNYTSCANNVTNLESITSLASREKSLAVSQVSTKSETHRIKQRDLSFNSKAETLTKKNVLPSFATLATFASQPSAGGEASKPPYPPSGAASQAGVRGEGGLAVGSKTNAAMPPCEEFVIQPSTVLFVRQKEQVSQNQLLAEFSSSTLQSTNDQIEITQQVLSETAGQVWFKELHYGNRKGPGSGSLGTHFSSQKLGGIWVLAGQPVPNALMLNPRMSFCSTATQFFRHIALTQFSCITTNAQLANLLISERFIRKFNSKSLFSTNLVTNFARPWQSSVGSKINADWYSSPPSPRTPNGGKEAKVAKVTSEGRSEYQRTSPSRFLSITKPLDYEINQDNKMNAATSLTTMGVDYQVSLTPEMKLGLQGKSSHYSINFTADCRSGVKYFGLPQHNGLPIHEVNSKLVADLPITLVFYKFLNKNFFALPIHSFLRLPLSESWNSNILALPSPRTPNGGCFAEEARVASPHTPNGGLLRWEAKVSSRPIRLPNKPRVASQAQGRNQKLFNQNSLQQNCINHYRLTSSKVSLIDLQHDYYFLKYHYSLGYSIVGAASQASFASYRWTGRGGCLPKVESHNRSDDRKPYVGLQQPFYCPTAPNVVKKSTFDKTRFLLSNHSLLPSDDQKDYAVNQGISSSGAQHTRALPSEGGLAREGVDPFTRTRTFQHSFYCQLPTAEVERSVNIPFSWWFSRNWKTIPSILIEEPLFYNNEKKRGQFFLLPNSFELSQMPHYNYNYEFSQGSKMNAATSHEVELNRVYGRSPNEFDYEFSQQADNAFSLKEQSIFTPTSILWNREINCFEVQTVRKMQSAKNFNTIDSFKGVPKLKRMGGVQPTRTDLQTWEAEKYCKQARTPLSAASCYAGSWQAKEEVCSTASLLSGLRSSRASYSRLVISKQGRDSTVPLLSEARKSLGLAGCWEACPPASQAPNEEKEAKVGKKLTTAAVGHLLCIPVGGKPINNTLAFLFAKHESQNSSAITKLSQPVNLTWRKCSGAKTEIFSPLKQNHIWKNLITLMCEKSVVFHSIKTLLRFGTPVGGKKRSKQAPYGACEAEKQAKEETQSNWNAVPSSRVRSKQVLEEGIAAQGKTTTLPPSKGWQVSSMLSKIDKKFDINTIDITNKKADKLSSNTLLVAISKVFKYSQNVKEPNWSCLQKSVEKTFPHSLLLSIKLTKRRNLGVKFRYAYMLVKQKTHKLLTINPFWQTLSLKSYPNQVGSPVKIKNISANKSMVDRLKTWTCETAPIKLRQGSAIPSSRVRSKQAFVISKNHRPVIGETSELRPALPTFASESGEGGWQAPFFGGKGKALLTSKSFCFLADIDAKNVKSKKGVLNEEKKSTARPGSFAIWHTKRATFAGHSGLAYFEKLDSKTNAANKYAHPLSAKQTPYGDTSKVSKLLTPKGLGEELDQINKLSTNKLPTGQLAAKEAKEEVTKPLSPKEVQACQPRLANSVRLASQLGKVGKDETNKLLIDFLQLSFDYTYTYPCNKQQKVRQKNISTGQPHTPNGGLLRWEAKYQKDHNNRFCSTATIDQPIWLSIHLLNNNLSNLPCFSEKIFSTNKIWQMRNTLNVDIKNKQIERNDGSLDQHVVHTVHLPIVSFPYILHFPYQSFDYQVIQSSEMNAVTPSLANPPSFLKVAKVGCHLRKAGLASQVEMDYEFSLIEVSPSASQAPEGGYLNHQSAWQYSHMAYPTSNARWFFGSAASDGACLLEKTGQYCQQACKPSSSETKLGSSSTPEGGKELLMSKESRNSTERSSLEKKGQKKLPYLTDHWTASQEPAKLKNLVNMSQDKLRKPRSYQSECGTPVQGNLLPLIRQSFWEENCCNLITKVLPVEKTNKLSVKDLLTSFARSTVPHIPKSEIYWSAISSSKIRNKKAPSECLATFASESGEGGWQPTRALATSQGRLLESNKQVVGGQSPPIASFDSNSNHAITLRNKNFDVQYWQNAVLLKRLKQLIKENSADCTAWSLDNCIGFEALCNPQKTISTLRGIQFLISNSFSLFLSSGELTLIKGKTSFAKSKQYNRTCPAKRSKQAPYRGTKEASSRVCKSYKTEDLQRYTLRPRSNKNDVFLRLPPSEGCQATPVLHVDDMHFEISLPIRTVINPKSRYTSTHLRPPTNNVMSFLSKFNALSSVHCSMNFTADYPSITPDKRIQRRYLWCKKTILNKIYQTFWTEIQKAHQYLLFTTLLCLEDLRLQQSKRRKKHAPEKSKGYAQPCQPTFASESGEGGLPPSLPKVGWAGKPPTEPPSKVRVKPCLRAKTGQIEIQMCLPASLACEAAPLKKLINRNSVIMWLWNQKFQEIKILGNQNFACVVNSISYLCQLSLKKSFYGVYEAGSKQNWKPSPPSSLAKLATDSASLASQQKEGLSAQPTFGSEGANPLSPLSETKVVWQGWTQNVNWLLPTAASQALTVPPSEVRVRAASCHLQKDGSWQAKEKVAPKLAGTPGLPSEGGCTFSETWGACQPPSEGKAGGPAFYVPPKKADNRQSSVKLLLNGSEVPFGRSNSVATTKNNYSSLQEIPHTGCFRLMRRIEEYPSDNLLPVDFGIDCNSSALKQFQFYRYESSKMVEQKNRQSRRVDIADYIHQPQLRKLQKNRGRIDLIRIKRKKLKYRPSLENLTPLQFCETRAAISPHTPNEGCFAEEAKVASQTTVLPSEGGCHFIGKRVNKRIENKLQTFFVKEQNNVRAASQIRNKNSEFSISLANSVKLASPSQLFEVSKPSALFRGACSAGELFLPPLTTFQPCETGKRQRPYPLRGLAKLDTLCQLKMDYQPATSSSSEIISTVSPLTRVLTGCRKLASLEMTNFFYDQTRINNKKFTHLSDSIYLNWYACYLKFDKIINHINRCGSSEAAQPDWIKFWVDTDCPASQAPVGGLLASPPSEGWTAAKQAKEKVAPYRGNSGLRNSCSMNPLFLHREVTSDDLQQVCEAASLEWIYSARHCDWFESLYGAYEAGKSYGAALTWRALSTISTTREANTGSQPCQVDKRTNPNEKGKALWIKSVRSAPNFTPFQEPGVRFFKFLQTSHFAHLKTKTQNSPLGSIAPPALPPTFTSEGGLATFASEGGLGCQAIFSKPSAELSINSKNSTKLSKPLLLESDQVTFTVSERIGGKSMSKINRLFINNSPPALQAPNGGLLASLRWKAKAANVYKTNGFTSFDTSYGSLPAIFATFRSEGGQVWGSARSLTSKSWPMDRAKLIHQQPIDVAKLVDSEITSVTNKINRKNTVTQVTNLFTVFPGQLLTYGENLTNNFVTTESGQVLYVDSQKAIIRKAQTVLIYSQAAIAVLSGEWIKKGTPLMALSYQKLVTGDIVQGLPKIEQFFEAPVLKDGTFWGDSLQAKLNQFFQEHKEQLPLAEAVRKGFSKIQRVLVEGVQRVYISQGVLIADKHLEVIVRQMTCKGRILYSGDTGFLRNELVSLDKIESVNQVTYGQKALYHPQVRGITDASLESESFLSAASFQETTRVLSRDAIIGKTDLMRGLKERVIVGELIQAGTGLANNNVYNLL